MASKFRDVQEGRGETGQRINGDRASGALQNVQGAARRSHLLAGI
jgi:hypothetical protein